MESEKNGFGPGYLVAAFLGGAAAGALATLLTAPRSGGESRARMRSYVEHRREDAARLPAAARAAGDAAREAFTEAMHESDGAAS
jgi:gas vesicle protein